MRSERSSSAGAVDGDLLIEIGNQLPGFRFHIYDRKIDRSGDMAVRERFFRHDVEDHERAISKPRENLFAADRAAMINCPR